MKPERFSTANANYIVVLEPEHTKPTLSWIAEKFDVLVTELPQPPTEALYASPDFPDNRSGYIAAAWYLPVLKKLQERGIPMVFADTPVPFRETDAALRRYYLKKPVRKGSIAALLLGGLLGGGAYGWRQRDKKAASKKKESEPKSQSSPAKKRMTRREFSQKSGMVAGGAVAGLGAVGLVGSLASSPVVGLEGRSAIIAERCESDLAPQFSSGGQKPTILIHIGAGHDDIVDYLKNPQARFKMLQRIAPEIKRLPPPFQRFQGEIFIFTFGPKAVERKVLKVPTVLERLQQRGLGAGRLSRRDLFATAFGRRPLSPQNTTRKRKPVPHSRTRRA